MGDFQGHPFRGNQYTVRSARLTHDVQILHEGSLIQVDSRITNPDWLSELNPKAAEMSVHIDKSTGIATGRIDARRHGKGYGRETFEAVMRELTKFGAKEYHAYVEHSNIDSQDMVKKAGGVQIKEGPHGRTYRVPVGDAPRADSRQRPTGAELEYRRNPPRKV
jgi:hypothetical protein